MCCGRWGNDADGVEIVLQGAMTAKDLRPADNDYLQRWPVSKRVNLSKADDIDASLIEAQSSAPADQLPLM
jgi:hypothetical protein